MDGVKEEVIEGDCIPWMDSGVVVKLEPAWSMEEDSPDQPSAVYSTVQAMSDNTSGSLLSLKRGCVCLHCSAAFVLVSSLELHQASVHGEFTLDMVSPESSTPDRCDAGDCSNTDIDKTVDRQGNRKTTTKTEVDDNNTGEKDGKKRSNQHKCDVCRKFFSAPSQLKRHKLIHSRVKPVVCDVCSKSFSQASSLEMHKRVHTDKRPFKCPHCDSALKHSGSLQHHIRSVHEGHRPHVCDVCGAAFSQNGHLTVHRRTHTGEKPHVCPDCGKRFADPGALGRHRLTHSGEKPHGCPHCPAGFRSVQYLKKHVEEIHQ